MGIASSNFRSPTASHSTTAFSTGESSARSPTPPDSCAAFTQFSEGGDPVTLEYKINFLRPAKGDRIVAEGFVLRAGKSVAVARVDVYVESAGEERKHCAAMQQSVMRAPGELDIR